MHKLLEALGRDGGWYWTKHKRLVGIKLKGSINGDSCLSRWDSIWLWHLPFVDELIRLKVKLP